MCWALLAIDAIELAMAIKKCDALPPSPKHKARLTSGHCADNLKLVLLLSKQDLIDCDLHYKKGCEGGLMTTTLEEEEASKSGICSEANYPYLEAEDTCSENMCTPIKGSIVKGQVDVRPHKTNTQKENPQGPAGHRSHGPGQPNVPNLPQRNIPDGEVRQGHQGDGIQLQHPVGGSGHVTPQHQPPHPCCWVTAQTRRPRPM